MDEKYISVTKFKETLAKLTVEGGTEATKTTIARTLGKVVPKLLDDEPFADVQPVVHCKDCKYAQNPNDTMVYCTYFECGTMSQNDFCSQGERSC